MKDEFLATLSHELRTPMNAVLGWTRMLRAGVVRTDRVPGALEAVERNAVAQNRLIEDLLDVSRIVTGKFRLDVQPVDLRALVEAAIDGDAAGRRPPRSCACRPISIATPGPSSATRSGCSRRCGTC